MIKEKLPGFVKKYGVGGGSTCTGKGRGWGN